MTSGTVSIRLEPLSVELEMLLGVPLISALSAHGVEFPCGGSGLCGGCGVRVMTGALPITAADRATFSPAELGDGWRLACHARATMPLVIECGQWQMDILTDNSTMTSTLKSGLGIAIDLGTTTIAAQMVDLATGRVLGVETGFNPQAPFGSDVMSRIRAALNGADLTSLVRLALGQMISKLAGSHRDEIVEVILVGNTVMHHMFSGLDVEPLSRAPFHSPNLGQQHFHPRDLAWELPSSCRIRFERCLGGFVGSDILAGIVAAGMSSSTELLALIDLGTNGEIAIGNRDGVICASTAAGPAFEAGAIRMGMRAATGAISRVWLDGGEISVSVIGGVEPRGLCGSALVDAVAAGLETGSILPSGRIADRSKVFAVKLPVTLIQSDIRELQLAKGAIASGFRLLLKQLGATAAQLASIHLAGAFGNYVQAESAIRIGLIEAPRALIYSAGNTALRGAKILLLSEERPLLPAIEHVSLAADPDFQDEFMSCIGFP